MPDTEDTGICFMGAIMRLEEHRKPPLSRKAKFKLRLRTYRWRIKHAWAVLRGNDYDDYDY